MYASDGTYIWHHLTHTLGTHSEITIHYNWPRDRVKLVIVIEEVRWMPCLLLGRRQVRTQTFRFPEKGEFEGGALDPSTMEHILTTAAASDMKFPQTRLLLLLQAYNLHYKIMTLCTGDSPSRGHWGQLEMVLTALVARYGETVLDLIERSSYSAQELVRLHIHRCEGDNMKFYEYLQTQMPIDNLVH